MHSDSKETNAQTLAVTWQSSWSSGEAALDAPPPLRLQLYFTMVVWILSSTNCRMGVPPPDNTAWQQKEGEINFPKLEKSLHKNISTNMTVFFFDLYFANRNIQWRGVSRGIFFFCQFSAFLSSSKQGSNSEMNTFWNHSMLFRATRMRMECKGLYETEKTSPKVTLKSS